MFQCHCGCFTWEFQITGSLHQQLYFYVTCVWCLGWIQVEFEWYHQFHILQKSLYYNIYLLIVFLYLLHQCVQWNYHDYVKWINICFKYLCWRHVAIYFFRQVCVIDQFRCSWLMSNDILLQILTLWVLKLYVKYFNGFQNCFFKLST